eukprot:677282-Alexandrium_andersonii.AAC.1
MPIPMTLRAKELRARAVRASASIPATALPTATIPCSHEPKVCLYHGSRSLMPRSCGALPCA